MPQYDPIEILKRHFGHFTDDNFSTQVPAVDRAILENEVLIRWVGHLYGTNQYALTDKGKEALKGKK